VPLTRTQTDDERLQTDHCADVRPIQHLPHWLHNPRPLSLNDDLFDWLTDRPAWQQEAFLRAVSGAPLSDQDHDDIIAMILNDAAAPAPRAVRRADLPADLPSGASVTLDAIRHVEGVNRLAPGGEILLIGQGINVVYGHNGSGKSGWARIPKHAGRAEVRQPVQGDVYVAEHERPEPIGEIRWSSGNTRQTTRYALREEASSDLAGMSVFDAACGQNLLSKDHEVDYAPQALDGLQRLARAQVAGIARIEQRIAALRPIAELDLHAFGPGTKIRLALERLSAETSIERLRAAADVTPEQAERCAHLARQVAEIDGRTSEDSARAAERDAERLESLAAALDQAATRVDAEAVAKAAQEHAAVRAAETLLSEMSAARFDGEPMAGVGTEPWMVLWRAAEAFVGDVHQEPLPSDHDGGRCPLCMQELSPDAHDRLRRFAVFARSDAESQLARARDAVALRQAALPDVERVRETHEAALARCAESSVLGDAVERWLTVVGATVAGLSAARDDAASAPVPPSAGVRELAAGRRAHASELRSLRDPGREAALRDELAELRAAEALAARLDSIERRVRDMKDIVLLEHAKRELTTMPVSTRLRVMAGAFVTDELERALHEHLAALNFQDVHVVACTTSGREGNPRVGLKIKAKSKIALDQVLSDGEQRRLALAFFLAEVSVGSPGQPIVLDDPVCSVDHHGRRHIAKTLARAARDRQVVVFTHELTFFEELVAAAKSLDVAFHHQYVSRSGGRTGRVHDELPWEGTSANKRCKRLRHDLALLEKLHQSDPSGEAYANEATRIAVRLREAFERAVEDDVIAGVVKRGDPAVHITQLRDVAWTPEIHQMAQRGLDDNSAWAHDRSRAANAAPPTPVELREGIDLLAKLVQATAAIVAMRKQQLKQMAPVPGGSGGLAQESGEVKPLRQQLPGLSTGTG
jgi:hypothetical protein